MNLPAFLKYRLYCIYFCLTHLPALTRAMLTFTGSRHITHFAEFINCGWLATASIGIYRFDVATQQHVVERFLFLDSRAATVLRRAYADDSDLHRLGPYAEKQLSSAEKRNTERLNKNKVK